MIAYSRISPGYSVLRKPRGTARKRCYAIGDVHGRLDLLTELFGMIESHNAKRTPREAAIVLLGDLIDRGPDSKGVVDFVRQARPRNAKLYVIGGNHEELMLRSLDGDEEAFQTWMTNGGTATAQSYGVDATPTEGRYPERARRELIANVPSAHTAFLKSCVDSIRFGDYLLVHAGVRPGLTLAEQTPQDLRWIRKSFLESQEDHGFVVVHGHSTRLDIEERKNRIGIDTGAYRSDLLTAIWIEDDSRGFLQARGKRTDVNMEDLFAK